MTDSVSAGASTIMVLGGASSGKSRYAEQLATALGPRVLYVATAESRDAEMAERVRRHQARRPPTWLVIEAPLHPIGALDGVVSPFDVVLFECLSLWVSNLVLTLIAGREDPQTAERARVEECVLDEVRQLVAWGRQKGVPLIVVSSEVGLGLVPPYPIGRIYRDVLGRANQLVAREASRVYYLVAGLAVELKALGASPFPMPL